MSNFLTCLILGITQKKLRGTINVNSTSLRAFKSSFQFVCCLSPFFIFIWTFPIERQFFSVRGQTETISTKYVSNWAAYFQYSREMRNQNAQEMFTRRWSTTDWATDGRKPCRVGLGFEGEHMGGICWGWVGVFPLSGGKIWYRMPLYCLHKVLHPSVTMPGSVKEDTNGIGWNLQRPVPPLPPHTDPVPPSTNHYSTTPQIVFESVSCCPRTDQSLETCS